MHAELPDHGHGVGVFDSFGYRLDVSLASRLDDGAHTLLQFRVTRQSLHQRAVDFQVVDGQCTQQTLRIPSGAEVFEREIDAALVQFPQQTLQRLQVSRCDFLRHLHAQTLWLSERCFELAIEPVHQRRIEHAVFRQAHEQLIGLTLGDEGQ